MKRLSVATYLVEDNEITNTEVPLVDEKSIGVKHIKQVPDARKICPLR